LRWLSRKVPPESCSTNSALIGVAPIQFGQFLDERQLGIGSVWHQR
jgi:hypothetical protein